MADLPTELEIFAGGTGGFDSWLTTPTPELLECLEALSNSPLTCAQVNQLLTLSHEAAMSPGFFRYYWVSEPPSPYRIRDLPGYASAWSTHEHIVAMDQFRWGLTRFYIDALLYFGNVRTAYRMLRSHSYAELENFVNQRMFNTEGFKDRGPALKLDPISKDDRYLIAEMACKSFAPADESEIGLREVLLKAYEDHLIRGGGRVSFKELLSGDYIQLNH